MRSRLSLFLLVAAFGVSACQTDRIFYDTNSFVSRPSAPNYGNSDEFVRDSIVYLAPRACAFYRTSDTVRASENQRYDKFSIQSIAENTQRDGWYLAYLSVTNAYYRALGFYFNKDTGDYSCTGRTTRKTNSPVEFVPGRYLSHETLPPIRTALAGQPESTSVQASVDTRLVESIRDSTDYRLCAIALKTDKSGWDISMGSAVAEYVREAKRRNLTPQACIAVLAPKSP